MRVVLPAPVWPTIARVWPGSTRKETSRRTQSSSAEADSLSRGIDGNGLVEELEDALGSGHGGLQDVEFFAEVLDGAEKTGGVHGEGGEHAEAEAAGEDAIASGPVD